MSDPSFRDRLRAAGLDPRRTLASPAVAATGLEGRVPSRRFIQPWIAHVRREKAALRRAPETAAPRDSELVFGEEVAVIASERGWALVQSKSDGYVGHLEAEALAAAPVAATHRLAVPASFIYPEPDIKTGPAGRLFLGARVNAAGCEDARFLHLPGQGYVWKTHLAAISEHASDFAGVAEMFLGTPYLWGGRTADGLDCSALVQLALAAAGINAPRDSDMQWEELGHRLCEGLPEKVTLGRGDLVFWQGHVGILLCPDTLLHANGHHMQVRREPLKAAVRRIGEVYGPVLGVKRMG